MPIVLAIIALIAFLLIVGAVSTIRFIASWTTRLRCRGCERWMAPRDEYCSHCGKPSVRTAARQFSRERKAAVQATTPAAAPEPPSAGTMTSMNEVIEGRRPLLRPAKTARVSPLKEPARAGPAAQSPAEAQSPPMKPAPRPVPVSEPIPQEEPAAVSNWPEVMMRSVLYVGVFGIVVAVLVLLYSIQDRVSSQAKFGLVVAFTISVYVLGRLLWAKWNYERTGMAFVLLSALLLPLNYYAAKVFGLIIAEHTLAEWGIVLCACSVVYVIVSLRVKEAVMPYVTLHTFAVGVGLIVFHYNPPWLGWGGCALTAAALFQVWNRFGPRFRVPVLTTAIGAGSVAGLSYLQKIVICLRPGWFSDMPAPTLLSIGLYGICLSVMFLSMAHQLRRIHKSFGAPFLMAANLLVIVVHILRTRDDVNITPLLFAAAAVLWGVERLISSWQERIVVPDESAESDAVVRPESGLAWRGVSFGVASIATLCGLLSCLGFTIDGVPVFGPVTGGSAGSMAVGLLIGSGYFISRYRAWRSGIFLALTMIGALLWHLAIVRLPPGTDVLETGLWLWAVYCAVCTVLGCIVWPLGVKEGLQSGVEEPSMSADASEPQDTVSSDPRSSRAAGPGVRARLTGYGLAVGSAALIMGEARRMWMAEDWMILVVAASCSIVFYGAVSFARPPLGRVFCRFAAIANVHVALLAVCGAQDVTLVLTGLLQMFLAAAFQYINVQPSIGSWKMPMQIAAWFTFLCFGTTTMFAGILKLGGPLEYSEIGLTLTAFILALAYFAGLAVRYRSRVLVLPLALLLYPTVYLITYWLGLVPWSVGDFIRIVPCVSAAILAIYAVLGRDRLAFWYPAGFEVAGWMTIFSLPIVFDHWSWSLTLVPALALALWARFCLKDQLRRTGMVVFACGGTLTVAYRQALDEVMQWNIGDTGLAMLPAVACALLVGVMYWHRDRRSSCYGLLVLAGITSGHCLTLALSESNMYGMLCFLTLSLLAGLVHMNTRWTWVLYVALGLLQPAFYLMLDLLGVSVSHMRLAFVVVGGVLVAFSRLGGSSRSETTWNPLMITGCLMTFLGIAASLYVAGAWSVGPSLDSTIISLLLAGVVYAVAAKLSAAPKLMALSTGLWLISYYLILHRFSADTVFLYSLPPGLLLVLVGIGNRLETGGDDSDSGAGNGHIKLGMAIIFLPAIIQTLRPDEHTAAVLTAFAAVAILSVSLSVRVKWLFYSSLAALTMVIIVQVFHLISMSDLPKWFWIGLVSVVLIGIGFLNERRFKKMLSDSVGDARGRLHAFFFEWY